MNKDLRKLFADKAGVKIDLGCGEHKQGPEWIGVDVRKMKGVEIVQDLEKFPWADIPDECANLVMASHVVEHINPAGGIFLKFMDEVWRIMKPGGQFMISLPYAGSSGFWQDPTHVNGCNETTWTYFDPLARDAFGRPYNLYFIYRPKPWKIDKCSYSLDGFMEVLLIKRRVDKSYMTLPNFENKKEANKKENGKSNADKK